MPNQNENPAVGAAGFDDAFPGGNCNLVIAEKADVAQAKIDLLTDDIADTAGWLVSQLSVIPSQREAADIVGIIYTLRRSRAYWRHISEVARELAAVNDERLSAKPVRRKAVEHG
jgi:hypothetical protein